MEVKNFCRIVGIFAKRANKKPFPNLAATEIVDGKLYGKYQGVWIHRGYFKTGETYENRKTCIIKETLCPFLDDEGYTDELAFNALKEIVMNHYLTKRGFKNTAKIYHIKRSYNKKIQRYTIAIYYEDLGKDNMSSFFANNDPNSLRPWFHDNAHLVVPFFQSLKDIGFVHGDAWPQNLVYNDGQIKMIDLESSYLSDDTDIEIVRNVFSTFQSHRDELVRIAFHNGSPRIRAHTNFPFDMIYFVYSSAYLCKEDYSDWWMDFTNNVLSQPAYQEFFNLASNKYLTKFCLQTDEGNAIRESFRVPRSEDGEIVI